MATFLEKGGALEGQAQLPTAEGASSNGGPGVPSSAVVEGRRRRLVNCALFIASFLQWDLSLFEKRYITDMYTIMSCGIVLACVIYFEVIYTYEQVP